MEQSRRRSSCYSSSRRRQQRLVHFIPLPILLIAPVLLALLTGWILFLHSTTDLAMLWSQCHARERLPWLATHLPDALATPACFVISFFEAAVGGHYDSGSGRALASMATLLAFLAALLTISLVESARACNAPSAALSRSGSLWLPVWLASSLVTATPLAWQLVFVPAALGRARAAVLARRSGALVLVGAAALDPDAGVARRCLRDGRAEALAIPTAVAAGFVVPAVLMLVLGGHPVAVAAWLVFPVWVVLVRRGVRFVVTRLKSGRLQEGGEEQEHEEEGFHLESRHWALFLVYALPVLCSVVAHVLLIRSAFFLPDDRRALTRLALRVLEIEAIFTGVTVLYWVLVEAGWRVVLVTILGGAALGPGAGVCVGWIVREGAVEPGRSVTAVAVGVTGNSGGSEATERSPLLRY